MDFHEKHEYRYWIMAIGWLFLLLGDGHFIPTGTGFALLGISGYQIYDVFRSRKEPGS